MGNPIFRFTLSHDSLGSMVISEPDGWKDAKLKMERHPEFFSLVEYFEGSFIFYGENNIDNGGADFIKQCENLYGFDTTVEILIEADIDGDGDFEETIFNGQLDLTQLKEVQDNKISVPVIRSDTWAKFIARKDVPVNIRSTTDLDGNAVSITDHVDLNLTSQKVKMNYYAYVGDLGVSYSEFTNNNYYQIDFNDVIILDEIKERYTLPRLDNTELPGPNFVTEYGGSYDIDIRIVASRTDSMDLFAHSVKSGTNYIDYYIQFNNQTPIAFSWTDITIGSGTRTLFTYKNTITLDRNTQIRIYGQANTTNTDDLNILGSDVIPGYPATIPYNSYCKIVAHTTFPSSNAQAYLIHDAVAAIIDRISPGTEVRSEYLGSTVTNRHQYSANGCGWKNTILPGLQVRGYTFDEKQFSLSFMQWWKGVNPLLFLGLGYDDTGIKIENRSYFYDATSISAFFENVREISRVYDDSMIFGSLEFGFDKWQSEDKLGLDDPQTKRTWTTGRKQEGKLTIYSDFIAAAIAIETTRRTPIKKEEDYKYDDEVFIIAINDTQVSPDRYVPELNENFNSITGISDPDTRYNSIHTPLRMLLRWGAWWNGCLQKYQSSSIKFEYGEGNYDMVSDYACASGDQCIAVICDSLSEKQNISLGPPSNYGSVFGYLHLPLLYTVEIINFTWDDYLLIRNNRNKAIGISQTLDNFKRFFIKELTYDVCKGKCKIIAWPFDEMPIRIIETTIPDRSDSEPDEECPSYYVAEFASTLDGWTSDGGEDIPAATLESLSGWDNAGIDPRIWATGATPSTTLNGVTGSNPPQITDYLRGEIDTVVGLTYAFDWEIEVGSDNREGNFIFMLLDADNNILDSETVPFESTSNADVITGTTTLSPEDENGVYFAIQVEYTTQIVSCNFEVQSVSLSGGTGSVSVPLPSWAWSPNYAGSAKAEISYEGYGVKNFVLDPVTVPQESHTIEIGYAVPVNNSNLSLRLRILDASDVELYNNIFASDIADGNQKTASFDILDSDVWTGAAKYEISVEELSTPVNFESGDEVYITKVEISICSEYPDAPFAREYQDILDYATSQGFTLPSEEQQALQNQFVKDLKNAGAWSRLDVLYVFATDGDKDFAKINWADPGNFDCTEEVSAVTFTADQGFTPSGANYLDTGWVPSSDAVNYTLNSASIFHHTNTNSQSNTQIDYGVRHTSNALGRILILTRSTLNTIGSVALNSGVSSAGSNSNSIGFYLNNRNGSGTTNHDVYKDSVLNNGTNAASGALPDQSVYIGGFHESTGAFNSGCNRQISMWGAGSSMLDIQAALYTAWNTYFTSL